MACGGKQNQYEFVPKVWMAKPKDVQQLLKASHKLIGRGRSFKPLEQYLSQFWSPNMVSGKAFHSYDS